MKIVVCLKQIVDPELSPNVFKLDPIAKKAAVGKYSLVINPFDENALELALQLKEKIKDCHIVALTYGQSESVEIMRKALSLMANEAIMVIPEGDALQDSYATAMVLAEAVKKIGSVDLVMCGRQAGDWDAGQVGPIMAEILGWPINNFVYSMECDNGNLKLNREAEGCWELVESPMPVVLTITNSEKNILRVPKVKNAIMAHKKPITQWSPTDLGLKPEELNQHLAYKELRELRLPVYDVVCEIIEGEEPEEKVTELLKRIKELKVL